MASPVVHFEIRSPDPDATRKFFGQLFGWTFPDGGCPATPTPLTDAAQAFAAAEGRAGLKAIIAP
jgi:predicted enzyme related to lactoylglutathione lyase